MEARVFVGIWLARGDLSLLGREDLLELRELRLGDALRGKGRDRRLDESPEFDDVGERMTARDETGERTGQIVRRGLPDERAAAGACLDDPEKLERAERFTNGRTRDLELLRELSLGRKLVAGTEVALFEETLDLLDDALIEADAADRLDDGQGLTSQKASGQVVRPDVMAQPTAAFRSRQLSARA